MLNKAGYRGKSLLKNFMTALVPLTAFLLALGLAPGCGSSSDDDPPAQPGEASQPDSPNENPSGEDNLRTLELSPYRETCQAEGPRLCLVAKIEGGDRELLYADVENLAWQWGHSYKIEAEVIEDPNPPADGPAREYKLTRILSDTSAPANSTFDTDLTKAFVAASPECSFTLAGSVTFRTQTQAACDTLNNLLNADRRALATFAYTGNADSPIILKSVKAATGDDNETWTSIQYEEFLDAPENGCTKPRRMTVAADGKYEISSCEGVRSGSVTDVEFSQVDDLADDLTDMNLNGPATCDNQATEQVATIDISSSSGESHRVYRVGGPSGACFRGNKEKAASLFQYMLELFGRYRVDPTPAPTPSATPGASPTPAPTAEPTPGVSPIPGFTRGA